MQNLTSEEKRIIIEALSRISTDGITWEQKIKPIVIKLQQSSNKVNKKQNKADKKSA